MLAWYAITVILVHAILVQVSFHDSSNSMDRNHDFCIPNVNSSNWLDP